jgi:hypothetical protein
MKLFELLIRSVDKALFLQSDRGFFPAGHNGPRHDPETPVRNTSHWLISILRVFEITGEQKYYQAAQNAANYLLSLEARPYGFTFFHRNKKSKSKCNGLIGQAWTIFALAYAAGKLGRPELLSLAEEVFLLHPFDEKKGLWQIREIDGTIMQIGATFNHQLWFAATGALLANGNSKIKSQIECFMENLNMNFDIYSSGLIVHSIHHRAFCLKEVVYHYFKKVTENDENKKAKYQAIGYHQFSLYAFALLKKIYPAHKLWDSVKLRKAVNYLLSPEYKVAIENNRFGFPYNVAGIEAAFVLSIFVNDSIKIQEEWVREQFVRCYDFKNDMMQLSTDDPITLAARIYEVTFLPELEVRV